MIIKIFFIRHGAVSYLEDKNKDLHVPLNNLGTLQAKELGLNFQKNVKTVHAIFASKLIRTSQTLSSISKLFNIRVVELDGLNEHFYNGNASNFHKEVEINPAFKYEGGEDLKTSKRRFNHTIEEIVKNNKGKVIVVGTHGTVFSNFMIDKFELTDDFFFEISYPDVYEVEFLDDVPIKYSRRLDLLPSNKILKL